MNWIKENKFLFGFLVVIVIGGAVGGWFLLGAKSHYDDSVSDYQRKIAELNRLQRLPIFPNKKNLDKIVAQQTEVNTEVSALAANLSAQQIPMEDVSPEVFQDRLKAAVTAVKTKAAQASPAIKVPEPKFFLGFDPYETAPPSKEAAGPLTRELKAIEWLTTQLIDSKVAEIRSLTRDPLPEEKGRAKEKKAAATPAPSKQPPGKAPEKGGVKYEVDKHRIEVVFVADQARFRKFLNAVVDYKAQFFIPRAINIKNEKPQAPPRVVATAEAVPPTPAASVAPGGVPAAPAVPAPAATEAASATPATYIVGEEKVEVTLILEMVDFREVTPK
jgi:hypothetical protein